MSPPSTSLNNTEVFVWAGESWGDDLRRHPAANWQEQYTKALDKADWSMSFAEWHTPDWELQKADGTVCKEGESSWESLKQIYSPFKAFSHQPQYTVIWDNDDGGWTLFGVANLFIDFPVDGEGAKVKDGQGKTWDVMVPSAFRFHYVKDSSAAHGGVLLKKTTIYGDSGPVVVGMLRRGMLQPEMLLGDRR